MPARYSTTYREKAGILKQASAPGDEWHIDWAIMGQHTLGLNGEEYALVVLDVGSGLGAVINTKTREDPWKLLDELAALWGHHPKAIRGDGAAEFEHSDGFKTWRRKHNIVLSSDCLLKEHRHWPLQNQARGSLKKSSRTGTPCKGTLKTLLSR